MDPLRVLWRARRAFWSATGSDAIIVAVRDTGPGIDPAKSDRIFDPFVTTKAKGMGLGLAICRMIIERHSGQLTALSDGKRGALFRFVLPTEPGDKAAVSANVQWADR